MFVKVNLSVTYPLKRVPVHQHSSTAPSMGPHLPTLFPQSPGREKMFVPLDEMIVSAIYS